VVDELRVDPAFPDAAGDELGILAAEIDDEHRPLGRIRLGQVKKLCLGH
jgi:hypothetical protein